MTHKHVFFMPADDTAMFEHKQCPLLHSYSRYGNRNQEGQDTMYCTMRSIQ